MTWVRRPLVLCLLILTACAGGAILPFVSPLLNTVSAYITGQTHEADFLVDAAGAITDGDPLSIIWHGADTIQSKYVLGQIHRMYVQPETTATFVSPMAFGGRTLVETLEPMVSLTFVNGVLYGRNDVDPDTTLDVIVGPPPPPPPPGDDGGSDSSYVKCLAGCLDLPPGQIARCVQECQAEAP